MNILNKGYPEVAITEIISNGFLTVDTDWNITAWNPAAEKIVGIPANDILGKNIWMMLEHILPKALYETHHHELMNSELLCFNEYWKEMEDWFNIFTYRSGDTLSVSFKSDHKRSQNNHSGNSVEKLKIINELYGFAAEVTNDCFWEWNIGERQIFWVGSVHKKVLGYPIENALIPQSFWEGCIHPKDKSRVMRKLNKALAEGTSDWEDEYRFKKANGQYADVFDRAHILNSTHSAIRMVGATLDITSVKLGEQKVFESEKKLSLIAKETSNAVVLTDAKGLITWVNSAFTQITEYELEEVVGRKPGEFLQGKNSDIATIEYLSERIRGELPFDCEIINYSKTGRQYWVHIQGQPLAEGRGRQDRFFSIQTDITEKKILQKKLMDERLGRQKAITHAVLTARKKERMEIGKELHDNLNQILGASKLYIELAKKDEQAREICLQKSTNLITEVIEEIRKISKALTLPDMILGLFESIRLMIEELALVNPVKIFFYHKGFDDTTIDKKMQLDIFRIIQEQVNNVIKHAKASFATIYLTRHSNDVHLLISDDGQGCDITTLTNGVGTINIQHRADYYQGSVTIESNPGEGYDLNVELRVKM